MGCSSDARLMRTSCPLQLCPCSPHMAKARVGLVLHGATHFPVLHRPRSWKSKVYGDIEIEATIMGHKTVPRSVPGGVIAFNALLMGFETDYEWGGWAVIENFLLCFLAESIALDAPWKFLCSHAGWVL